MTKPNDCKDCKSSNVVKTNDHGVHSVGCKVCLKSSNAKDSEEAAIIDWNELN